MRLTENAKRARREGSKWIAPGVLHPWDRERKATLWRGDRPRRGREALDRDVNYFVLQLERLGCKTLYSCGGHPDDFYIVFQAPYSVALKIAQCGYLRVGVDLQPNLFNVERRFKKDNDSPNTPKPKILRWAAMSWEEGLGPLRKKTR